MAYGLIYQNSIEQHKSRSVSGSDEESKGSDIVNSSYFIRLTHEKSQPFSEDLTTLPKFLFTMGTGAGAAIILHYGEQKTPMVLPS